jgi:hypothetical protein
MLGDEDRMAAPRRLFPVLVRVGRREATRNKVPGMFANDADPTRFKIGAILVAQREPGAESGQG